MLAKGFGKSLVKRYFVNPDTNQVEEHFHIEQKPWSVVLAVTDDREVLVVRQFKQGAEKILDELPAGTADWADESPIQVMSRELRQETGYEAGIVEPLAPQWMSTRNSRTRFYPFLALGCRKVGEAVWDTQEQIEPRAVELEVWLRMVFLGQVEEPSAIVATMLSLPALLKAGVLDPEDVARAAG